MKIKIQLIKNCCELCDNKDIYSNWRNSYGRIIALCKDHFEVILNIYDSEKIEEGLFSVKKEIISENKDNR